MTQKMVCLDVDGTTVDFDGHMAPAVRKAITDVMDAGHHVVIATGRSLNATLPVIRDLDQSNGYAVCSNGAVTLRLDDQLDLGYEIQNAELFDPSDALEQLRRRVPTAKFAIEIEGGEFLSTERFQDFSFGVQARGVSFEDLKSTQAVRMVVFSQDSTTDEFSAAVGAIGLQGVTYSVGYNAWLDVAAAGVTKASGLEVLREKLGVDLKDTVAVGDGFNDLEMLAWAGRGVAMGQAPEGVRRMADEVTGTIDEDGLATVLRSIL